MRIRKEIRALTADDRRRLVTALLELKKRGRYDEYVHWHHEVMKPTTYPWEPPNPSYRNVAHRGPAFLPWHREFLMQVDRDLQSADPAVTLPYWDWTVDAAMLNPAKSPMWAEDLMGGDGDGKDGWRVPSGPFSYKGGQWKLVHDPNGSDLMRRFGTFPNAETLPTRDDVNVALAEPLYDTPPYTSSPYCLGFRNRLEGWITQRGDPAVPTRGSQLHNRVHLWVGGLWERDGKIFMGSMVPMTSPNDPVFFLHHCFIDKLWADWQRARGKPFENHYAPQRDGPPGHNLDDQLKPWARSVRDVLDIAQLDYAYDGAPPPPAPASTLERVRLPAGATRDRSPFEAD